MVASLSFKQVNKTDDATNLNKVKFIALQDNTGNKYTLDITTNDLKVAYTPSGGNEKEYTVNGLATALGKLLTIDGSTAGKSVLAEEVAKKPVVDALIPELAKDNGITGIYTKKGVDDELAKKADTSAIPAAPDLSNYLETSKLAEEVVKKPVVDVLVPALATVGTDDTKKVYTKGTLDTSFAKIDASNLTDAANQKAFAEAILPAKNGQKSILVNKLGEALDRVANDTATDRVYGTAGQEKIAKDFLADKGLKPTPTDVANELITNNIQALQTAVAADAGLRRAVAENGDLQEAVAMDVSLRTAVAMDADLRTAVAAIPALQTAVAADAGLQTAVAQNEDLHKAIMPQPFFAIPQDSSAPFSWDF